MVSTLLIYSWTRTCLHAQLCPTLCSPMDCSLSAFSVHRILQARILVWVAFLPPRDLPEPGIKPASPVSPVLQADSLSTEPIFSSVTQSCPTLCDPMNQSMPGFPVHHQLPEFTQTRVHRVGDVIQLSHLLLSPSPPAPNPSQHQGLFKRVNSSHQVAKVLEFQLQNQSFQWKPRTDLL